VPLFQPQIPHEVTWVWSQASAMRDWQITTWAMAWPCAQVSPCGICGGQSGSETDFSLSSSVFPVNIIPPLPSILIYHLGDKQKARWWPQFRDTVSLHWHEQGTHQSRHPSLLSLPEDRNKSSFWNFIYSTHYQDDGQFPKLQLSLLQHTTVRTLYLDLYWKLFCFNIQVLKVMEQHVSACCMPIFRLFSDMIKRYGNCCCASKI
jgi:hypothetical protein